MSLSHKKIHHEPVHVFFTNFHRFQIPIPGFTRDKYLRCYLKDQTSIQFRPNFTIIIKSGQETQPKEKWKSSLKHEGRWIDYHIFFVLCKLIRKKKIEEQWHVEYLSNSIQSVPVLEPYKRIFPGNSLPKLSDSNQTDPRNSLHDPNESPSIEVFSQSWSRMHNTIVRNFYGRFEVISKKE